MSLLIKLFLAILAPALVLCKTDENPCVNSDIAEFNKVSNGYTDFALKFYQSAIKNLTDKNAVMSPLSVVLALTLLENGADGDTRQKLKSVLIGSNSSSDVLSIYSALQRQLSSNDDKTKLAIANAIYVQKKYAVKEDFLSRAKTCLNSEANTTDFAGNLEGARKEINSWVSEKTYQKIPELLKAGVLQSDTLFVLVNAIYFKSVWKNKFVESNTKPEKFYKLGKEDDVQNVPFMRSKSKYGYTETENYQVLKLAYDNENVSFYVFLPRQQGGLPAFEKELTADTINSAIKNISPTTIDLQLPRFIARSPIDLKDTFKSFGLEALFREPNLKRLSDGPLQVEEAVHEAFIEVNEKGTEAAAATAISGGWRTAGAGTVQFYANHPFLYAIIHEPTKAVIFIGRVNYIEEGKKD